MNRRAFLSIPVQGTRLHQSVYDAIISGAKIAGLSIINVEVNNPPTAHQLENVSPYVVHLHNRALLDSAELIIVEISQPSLGVGYELAVAQSLGLPILALCNSNLVPAISLMIRGIDYKRFHLSSYESLDDIAEILTAFATSSITALSALVAQSTEIVNHFDGLAAAYDESTEWRQNQEMLGWLSSKLIGRRFCLDVGAGTGLVGAHLKRDDSIVVGLDRSNQMLQHAAKRLDSVVQGDATALPFKASSFDGVCLRSVLHYLDDVRCLEEIRRVVRDDATVVCAQATGADIAAAAWWERLKQKTQPLRQRFYTVSILQQRFVAAGFKLVDVKSMRVSRQEVWEGVLRHCPAAEHEMVRAMFRAAPPEVRNNSNLQILPNGVAYDQHWTLLVAVPETNHILTRL